MQKKNTTPKTKRRTITQRARAIIYDDHYDHDTRESIAHQLNTKDPDLATCVARAEKGETILDFVVEEQKNKVARGKLAAALAEIMSNDLTPERLRRDCGNFITDISTQLLDDSEEMIGKALAFGDCGFVSCPGRDDGTVCPGPEAHEKAEGASA